jgi:aminopeptidase-like protein
MQKPSTDARLSSRDGLDARQPPSAGGSAVTGRARDGAAGRSTATAAIERSRLPDADVVGRELHTLMSELFPICRSLTGEGVRETFRILRNHAPFEVVEVLTGTPVYDWTIPDEWNIRDAWIANDQGDRVVDFRRSNLHVLGYSVPIRRRLTLAELREHLFTLPDKPTWIPFRTSYHDRNWGFCLSHEQLQSLQDGLYDVCIDSSLEPGHLTYGELVAPGRTTDEILVSSYVCHPSLANDGLSGAVLTAILAKYLSSLSLRYTYRFLLSPGTLGPLTWLMRNEDRLGRIKGGLVAACVGDPGRMTYKKSRRGDAEIDQAAVNVLRTSGGDYRVDEFTPWGFDERQFCSPGFDLPIGSLMRTPAPEFPEYHTSADNLEFVRPESLADSFQKYIEVFEVLEGNGTYKNQNPKGEPQLGRRGLYKAISTGAPREDEIGERALLWVLNLSDGEHSLLDIAERADLPFKAVRKAATALQEHGLLHAIGEELDD